MKEPKVVEEREIIKEEKHLHLFVSTFIGGIYKRGILDFHTMTSEEAKVWLQSKEVKKHDWESYWDLGEYLCGRREYRVEGTAAEIAIEELFNTI